MGVIAKAALESGTLDRYPWGADIIALVEPTAELLALARALGYREAFRGDLRTGFDVANARAADWARSRAGELVAEIDGVTRARVETLLRGLLGDAFDNSDVSAADIRSALLGEFDQMSVSRADLIADTEIATAAGKGAADAFADTGVAAVLISDGTESDEACAEADGQVWSVEYYAANVLEHPNCGRSATPLSEGEYDPAEVIDG